MSSIRSGQSSGGTTSPAKARVWELDLLRATALVCVVTIHSGAWMSPADAPPKSGLLPALIGIARFSVPAFVVASGAALTWTYAHRPMQAKEFLLARCARVLVPWIWAVPIFFLVAALWTHEVKDFHSFAGWALSGPGHLYFLVLITQLYAVFLVLPRRRPYLLLFTGLAVLLQIGLGWFHTYGPAVTGAAAWPLTYLAHEEFPFWVGYFSAGCLLGVELDWVRQQSRFWPVALLLAVASVAAYFWESDHISNSVWTQGTGSYLWPSRLPMTLAFFVVILWIGHELGLPKSFRPAVDLLARHSLGIYVIHPLPLQLLGQLTGGLPVAARLPLLVVAILALSTFLVAWGPSWLLRSQPAAALL